MRIVHLGMHGDGTGVAIAIRRIHQGLLDLGHDSLVFARRVWDPKGDPRIRILRAPRGPVWQRARRRLRHLLIERGRGRQVARARSTAGFHDARSPDGRELVDALPPCDVIVVHALLSWLDYREFFATAPQRAPIVSVLHDMGLFTGGCHYSQGCEKFVHRCGACPVLGSRRERDLSREIWRRKRAAYASVPPGRMHFVAPSQWVAEGARRSSLLQGFPVSVIPNGVDTRFFSPLDRRASRELLGIPIEAEVALFVGQPVTRVTKGFALLADALGRINREDFMLVSVGQGSPPSAVGISHLHLGYVADDRLLPVIYSAADMFVIPSLQENCPQTVLEAIACGLPVVGFATGGIVDLVRPGTNGTLVATGDVEGLSGAILDMLADSGRRAEMARNARRMAVQEFSLELQAQRYAALFDALVRGGSIAQFALPQAESLVSS